VDYVALDSDNVMVIITAIKIFCPGPFQILRAMSVLAFLAKLLLGTQLFRVATLIAIL
jgi:hypothetical protein